MSAKNKAQAWLQQKLSPEAIAISNKVLQSSNKLAITECNKLFSAILCPLGHITEYPNWVITGGKPPGKGYRKYRTGKKVFCHTCACTNRIYCYIQNILKDMLNIPFLIEYENPSRVRKSFVKRIYNPGLGISIIVLNNRFVADDSSIVITNNYTGDYSTLADYLIALANELQEKLINYISSAEVHKWIRELIIDYEYKYSYKNTYFNCDTVLENIEDLTSEFIYGDD